MKRREINTEYLLFLAFHTGFIYLTLSVANITITVKFKNI